MTLPGRGPKTAKERAADAQRSQSVNSADGLIATRPTGRRPTPLPTNGQNIVTGQAGDLAVSISATLPGNGNSVAGVGAVAIGDLASAGLHAVGIGRDVNAAGDYSVRLGFAGYAWLNAVGIGTEVSASGDSSVGIGYRALPSGQFAVCVGRMTTAAHVRAVAIADGATTEYDLEIALGTVDHIVIVRGKICLRDSAGGLHQLVVDTAGALSTASFP